MLYLFLAILCSSSIALIFKHSESNHMNRYAVTTANYFAAFAISLIMIVSGNTLSLVKSSKFSSFTDEFFDVVMLNNSLFSESASIIWAILIGIFAGVFFYLSFIYYQRSVKENGAGLSGTFGKLGILIPMAFSIILWNELPGGFQWAGIILSIVSILLVNFSLKEVSFKSINSTLLFLFFFGGMAEFSNKIFQKYAETSFKDVFLFFVFFTAFLISLFFTMKSTSKVTLKDVLLGFIVGLPNLFSSFFLILALNTVNTSVAFPIYSAGSIVLINLGGYIIYKERLSPKEAVSIVLTIVALIFINLK